MEWTVTRVKKIQLSLPQMERRKREEMTTRILPHQTPLHHQKKMTLNKVMEVEMVPPKTTSQAIKLEMKGKITALMSPIMGKNIGLSVGPQQETERGIRKGIMISTGIRGKSRRRNARSRFSLPVIRRSWISLR